MLLDIYGAAVANDYMEEVFYRGRNTRTFNMSITSGHWVAYFLVCNTSGHFEQRRPNVFPPFFVGINSQYLY